MVDADAEHLRGGQNDERQVAGDADSGDRLGPQSADPIQIHQDVERLKDHADQHEAGRLEKVARERSGGQVLHGRTTFQVPNAQCRMPANAEAAHNNKVGRVLWTRLSQAVARAAFVVPRNPPDWCAHSEA